MFLPGNKIAIETVIDAIELNQSMSLETVKGFLDESYRGLLVRKTGRPDQLRAGIEPAIVVSGRN